MLWIEVGGLFFELALEEASEGCEAQQNLQMVLTLERLVYVDGVVLLKTDV